MLLMLLSVWLRMSGSGKPQCMGGHSAGTEPPRYVWLRTSYLHLGHSSVECICTSCWCFGPYRDCLVHNHEQKLNLLFEVRTLCSFNESVCSAALYSLDRVDKLFWGGGPIPLALVYNPRGAWALHFQAMKKASPQHTTPNSISKYCSSELFMK